jgi:uncharacterized protein
MNITFIWDPSKSKTNYEKHGVLFQEARSVFYEENAIEFYDEEHSDDEDRYLMLGISDKLRILLVSYTTRKSNNVVIIRIISARKATKNEIINYKG